MEHRASQVALVVKNPPASAGSVKRGRFDPWVGKIPWRRKRQPLCILGWRISWTEEPCGLQRGVHEVTKSQSQLKQLGTHAD